MNLDKNFLSANIAGKFIKAKVSDLDNNNIYELMAKLERRGGKMNRCLFSPYLQVSSINGLDYTLNFIVDLRDFYAGNPTLDLNIFDNKAYKIFVNKNIHHTSKELDGNTGKWVYKLKNKIYLANKDSIFLNIIFQLEMILEREKAA